MKSTYVLMTTFAFVASALADNCTPGLDYCGATLLSKGNYQLQIDQALFDARVQEVNNGKDALFFCEGGNNGIIRYLRSCAVGDCVDAGTGNSDLCG